MNYQIPNIFSRVIQAIPRSVPARKLWQQLYLQGNVDIPMAKYSNFLHLDCSFSPKNMYHQDNTDCTISCHCYSTILLDKICKERNLLVLEVYVISVLLDCIIVVFSMCILLNERHPWSCMVRNSTRHHKVSKVSSKYKILHLLSQAPMSNHLDKAYRGAILSFSPLQCSDWNRKGSTYPHRVSSSPFCNWDIILGRSLYL